MESADKAAHTPPFVEGAKYLLFFGFLFALCLVSFSSVRDNDFWHSSDFFLLDQAIDASHDWRAVFRSDPDQPFQPLVKLVVFAEYKLFGLAPVKYYLFNIFVHTINAFLVYLLVFTLLRDRHIAILSSILFALAVGNYGKAVMVMSGISDLLITLLTLLTLLFYFKNELEKGGRLLSGWFIGSLLCFTLSLLTKATSFSILGCILAFHFFFRPGPKRRILRADFLVFGLVALISMVVKLVWLPETSYFKDFYFGTFFRNFGSYLVRMVFPVHGSRLVTDSGAFVQFFYQAATTFRWITFLTILSYSVFGFIFGNRTIRFFIAWTYITVMPFCFFKFPSDWLNIRYLYLVSIGFVMLLASATVLASRLLYQKAWRRFLPYALPALFVFLAHFIISTLDQNYETMAKRPRIEALKAQIEAKAAEPDS